MFDWMNEAIARLQGAWKFVLNPPATDLQIRQCASALGVALPPSYRSFLLSSDGASLFRKEWRDASGRLQAAEGFRILGTSELAVHNQEYRRARTDITADEWNDLVLFCHIPGTGGDYCGLDPQHPTADGEYAVVDCFHEFWPGCWKRAVLGDSFGAWLQRAFDAALRGEEPHYWLDWEELRSLNGECIEQRQRELQARLPRSS